MYHFYVKPWDLRYKMTFMTLKLVLVHVICIIFLVNLSHVMFRRWVNWVSNVLKATGVIMAPNSFNWYREQLHGMVVMLKALHVEKYISFAIHVCVTSFSNFMSFLLTQYQWGNEENEQNAICNVIIIDNYLKNNQLLVK